MQVLLDENGYVKSYALIGTLVDGIDIDDLKDEQLEEFRQNHSSYHINNGKMERDSQKAEKDKEYAINSELRALRESECFSVINRGTLWYNNLTEQQYEELSKWYKEWLDVTQTKTIPKPLSWI